jgi:hypothetical protein
MGIPEMETLWNALTIIGLEPHPEDKKNGAYDRVNLSDLG